MDTAQIIAAMRENPVLADEMRSVVLSREIQALPELVTGLTVKIDALVEAQARTDRRIEELVAAQARTDRRIEELVAAQARTDRRIEDLLSSQNRTQVQVDELVLAIKVLARQVGINTDSIAEIKGKMLEDSVRSQPARLGLRGVLRGRRPVERDELEDWLESAGFELDRLDPVTNPVLADLVLEGSSPADGELSAMVIEVSWKVDRYDVQRAQERAALLARTGRRTLAGVAGRAIDGPAAAAARSAGVHVFVSPGL